MQGSEGGEFGSTWYTQTNYEDFFADRPAPSATEMYKLPKRDRYSREAGQLMVSPPGT